MDAAARTSRKLLSSNTKSPRTQTALAIETTNAMSVVVTDATHCATLPSPSIIFSPSFVARGAWDFGVLLIGDEGGWCFLHLEVTAQAIVRPHASASHRAAPTTAFCRQTGIWPGGQRPMAEDNEQIARLPPGLQLVQARRGSFALAKHLTTQIGHVIQAINACITSYVIGKAEFE